MRVALLDSQPLRRLGVAHFLESGGGFVVVAQAATLAAGRDQAAREKAEVALTEFALPDGVAIGWLTQPAGAPSRPALVALGAGGEDRVVSLFRALGGSGWVLPTDPPACVAAALRLAVAGKFYASPSALGPGARSKEPGTLRGVTARELEVLLHLGAGSENAAIATALGVSVRTIETHLTNLKTKLGHPSVRRLQVDGSRLLEGAGLRR